MTIIYFIFAAIALGILVFIHELGHYFAARWVGMKVEAFSIGFGKPLLKWRVNEVDWQLGWLPFGGYVKIAGMDISKKEKQYNEPHEIPNGFFGKSPWKRIIVAFAGPFANFILAFLVFSAMWFMGGREKSFSDLTKRIGWVDPKSEAYSDGIRPGDILSKYDGKQYNHSKDLIYAAMLGGKTVNLQGYHVLYEEGQKKIPFDYKVQTYQAPNTLDGIMTTGILFPAKYLIYAPFLDGKPNPLPEGSPMEKSGIRSGDRIIWANGELLFSMEQLSHLINSNQTLLTIKRKDQIQLVRVPKVQFNDLILNADVREEIRDWQFEAGIKAKTQKLFLLPYNLSTDCYVEGPLNLIDQETYKGSLKRSLSADQIETHLEKGDKIIAIDGVKVFSAYQLLAELQNRHTLLIVKRGEKLQGASWLVQDDKFDKEINFDQLNALTNQIGISDKKQEGDLVILDPVQPKKMQDFFANESSLSQYESEYAKQRKQYEEIKDPEKRARALHFLEENQNKYLLGIFLQDKQVEYNPNPVALFGEVFVETWHTLKALLMGYLNPKWLSGPIGIVQVIHHGWTLGFAEALFWIGAISLNLGVLNLLPIPVLDGGYICLSFWELITGKKLKAKTMEKLIIPFVILLVGLLIFLTFQDISRIF